MPSQKLPPSIQVEDRGGWTIDTLRAYLLALMISNDTKYTERFEAQQIAMATALTAQKLAVDTALGAADRAVTKAEVAAEKRFDSVNEFRGLVADQQRTLMPRAESELLFKQLNEKIDTLNSTLTGKIDTNTQALLVSGAQKAGLKDGWAYLIGGIGLIGGIVGVLFHFIPAK